MTFIADRGVVFVACGETYIEEAREGLKAVQAFNPLLPACLISDSNEIYPEFVSQIYVARPTPAIAIKLEMFAAPFRQVLFLDTDAEVFASMDEVFELLDTFDMVVQQPSSGYHYKLKNVPNAFPEPNTGVIGFNRGPKSEEFEELWKKRFKEYETVMGREWDQRSFRHALYESSVRFAILPSEYNFMPYFPQVAMTDLKIIHGRPAEQRRLTKLEMDKRTGPRVFLPRFGCVRHYNDLTLAELITVACRGIYVLCVELVKRPVRFVRQVGVS